MNGLIGLYDGPDLFHILKIRTPGQTPWGIVSSCRTPVVRCHGEYGSYIDSLCQLCADICTACAEECERHTQTGMEHYRVCAEACRQCAEECIHMSALA
ncbi:MAG: four-helix bundle copper-binding protein [Chitinophagaceae bacterium]|nr:four-helix bundle copper-binding protein [Chitinophagaceae bacterium]